MIYAFYWNYDGQMSISLMLIDWLIDPYYSLFQYGMHIVNIFSSFQE